MAITFAGGWNRFRNLFSSGGVVNADEGLQYSGPLVRSNDANLSFSDARAMQSSTVFSCIRLTTETVGALPLSFYEKTEGGRKEKTDHYIYRLFRESPNAMMTPMQFREAMTAQLCVYGNAYARIEWERNPFESDAISLIPLRSECMNPMRSGTTITYHYSTKKGTHVFSKDSILHIKGWGFDGVIGVSPLAYMAQALGISLSADKHASKAFSSGGRPVGVLTTDRLLTPDQRAALRKIYEKINADDSDGTWVLEGGTGYTAITIPPDQLQMLETRKLQISELARFFLIPPHMIGDVDKTSSWGAGVEQQTLGFSKFTLNSYLERWEDAIAGALLNRGDRRKYYIEHNLEGLLRGDSKTRSENYASALQNRWMVINEVRKKENLPPIKGGDELPPATNVSSGVLNGNQNTPPQ